MSEAIVVRWKDVPMDWRQKYPPETTVGLKPLLILQCRNNWEPHQNRSNGEINILKSDLTDILALLNEGFFPAIDKIKLTLTNPNPNHTWLRKTA